MTSKKIERLIQSVRDLCEDVIEDDDGHESQDEAAYEAWKAEVSESLNSISENTEALVAQARADVRTFSDVVNPVLKKALERLTAIENTQSRISGWGDGVQRTADRMVQAANALASLDKVREYADRSVYVVRDRAAAAHAYVGVFPLNATGLKDARELRESQPGLIVCSAIWQGAIKVGDAIE